MSAMVLLLCLFSSIVGYYFYRFIRERKRIDRIDDKAILVTGCDSGFGRALVVRAAGEGMTVFAGCLTDQGIQSLKTECADLLVFPFKLDIAQDDSVKEARLFVDKHIGSKKFWGVVNNAGILTCFGPMDWCSPTEFRLAFEVNTLGGIRVTQAFSDLLKENCGRVVSTSSISGILATAGCAPYAVSKFGVEAWMDCYRREVAVYGVSCHIIEPSGFNTNLLERGAMEKRLDTAWNKMDDDVKEDYGEEYKKEYLSFWFSRLSKAASGRLDYVVDYYLHALTALRPRLRYQCGWDAILILQPLASLPTPLQDSFFSFLNWADPPPVPASLQPGGKYFKAHSD